MWFGDVVELLIETEGRQLIWGGAKFGGAAPYPVKGADTPSAARAPRAVDASRLVELKKAYAFMKEIDSPIPNGMVAIRPPAAGPGAQMVGSFKAMWRGVQPFLWIVLSAHEGKSAEVVMITRSDGKPFWRYFQAQVSGNTLDALTWSGGQRFVLKWSDAGGGEMTGMGSARDIKSVHVSTPFARLDG